MPSGYEKSPDYGSPGPWPTDIKITVAVALAIFALVLWYTWPAPAECRAVQADAVAVDGKATLKLDKIPAGECVTIIP